MEIIATFYKTACPQCFFFPPKGGGERGEKSPLFHTKTTFSPQKFPPFLITKILDVTKLSYHFNTFHDKVEDILLWTVLTFIAKM